MTKMRFNIVDVQRALDLADQFFRTGPITDKTYYNRSLYSPITYDQHTFFPVYAGFTTDVMNEYGLDHKSMLVCISPSAKLVENYMFGLRRYECIHTFYTDKYGGDNYQYNGNTGGFAEIRYHLFGSEDLYETFLDENPALSEFTFSTKKPRIDPSFWIPLPKNNKLHLPKVVERIIIEDRNSLDANLIEALKTIKYIFYLANFENEAFDPTNIRKGLQTAKNEIAGSMFYAAKIMDDLFNYLQSRKSSTTYKGHLDEEVLDAIRKNALSRSPILFYRETEYRDTIMAHFNAMSMDDEFRSIIDGPFPWKFPV